MISAKASGEALIFLIFNLSVSQNVGSFRVNRNFISSKVLHYHSEGKLLVDRGPRGQLIQSNVCLRNSQKLLYRHRSLITACLAISCGAVLSPLWIANRPGLLVMQSSGQRDRRRVKFHARRSFCWVRAEVGDLLPGQEVINLAIDT